MTVGAVTGGAVSESAIEIARETLVATSIACREPTCPAAHTLQIRRDPSRRPSDLGATAGRVNVSARNLCAGCRHHARPVARSRPRPLPSARQVAERFVTMSTTASPRARRAGRTLVVSLAAVALAAFVDDPWWAIVWCLLAVGAAGRLTGLARGDAPARRSGAAPRPSQANLSLGALGYLVGLPATWRALHALADLGIDPASVWGWALLLCGTTAFAIGYRLGAGPSRAWEG